jgi:hypothetical protein
MELDSAVVPLVDRGVRPQADGGIQRRGAFMKEVKGPDVDGAACEIDPSRRRSGESHDAEL